MNAPKPIQNILGLCLCLVLLAACGGPVEILSQSLPCVDDSDCPSQESCLRNRCVPYGSITQDQTCTDEDQCAEGLLCFGFECIPGCSDVYRVDDCESGQFCNPVDHTFVRDDDGVRTMIGTCEPSECNPSLSELQCAAGESCVHITETTGACVPGCSYGFAGGIYHDDCAPRDGLEHSCHPLGTNLVPVCLPSGDSDGPTSGQSGCHSIESPCYQGNICLNVVCRQMCQPGQTNPCPDAARCIELGERTDVSYCKAN